MPPAVVTVSLNRPLLRAAPVTAVISVEETTTTWVAATGG